ncbi:hypothetical protein Poli38472_006691 [Pythium oligandrum]|uniref:NADPH--hemoprotein reductase n=1 Tax=Pythium oligandrum TaxID=41045 RepID=A0A8K1C589_PYTOL|nr:hypothetical protein Poli38472_006691 [Pythium oligandrum]|eukprot:TMW56681.1 hypothetical protein Poli38472_006691 [Pythium oligandrum]
MMAKRVGRWRIRPHHTALTPSPALSTRHKALQPVPTLQKVAIRAFSASGMDAFMEFEREMALKRRQTQPAPSVPLEKPIPPKEDECCHLDCPNCVLLVYQEKLLEYELSLRVKAQPAKPQVPEPQWKIALLDAEPNPSQIAELEANNNLLYRVARNDTVSKPHRTKDGSWRSVQHIDLHVENEQRSNISEDASNIAVYAPNDADAVNRMISHLQVDPDLVFTAKSLDTSPPSASQQHRPFSTIGTVRDALTWSFDLIATPRLSFLRHLAAYATEESEITALTAPQALENILSTRNGKPPTLVDILDMFPSIHLDFASFYQFAPVNAPRYYTVSSSRRLFPDTVSITLGLRKTETQPIPRCSSYLTSLHPGIDSVRATFLQSSFVFPRHDRRPLMLISAGTGIAPFRAFLQDLEHEQELSSEQNHRVAYVFYGCRRPDIDYLYQDDLHRAQSKGYVDQLYIEFSELPGRPKRYVQDALMEQRELLATHLLANDGYIFVCGSLAMGRAVKQAIVEALRPHLSADADVQAFLKQLLARQQLVTELW